MTRFRQTHHIKVSCKPRSQIIPTSSRRSADWNHGGIDNLLEEEFGAIIESPQITQLPQKLNARLCTIELQCRHVHIINENRDLLARPGTEQGFPLLD